MSRRGNEEGSLYQRKADGRWVGAISLPGGKRKVVYAPRDRNTRSEAAARLRKVQAAIAAGRPVPNDQLTVRQYLEDQWLPATEEALAPKTAVSYRQTVRDHIVPYVGRLKLSRLEPQHVQALMVAVRKAGGSAHAAAYARSVLRIGLKMAEEWGLVARNAAALARPPKVEERVIHPLTPAEARHLLATIEDGQMSTFYLLAMTTGLRLGELLGLRWGDVDFDESIVQVSRQVQRREGGGLAERRTKTTASKAPVALTSMAREALWRHRLASGRIAGYVFAADSGGPLDPSNIRRHLRRALLVAGLPMRRPHDLRHSTATFLLEAGVPARVVQEILRHTNIRTTLGTYQHVDVRLQREAMTRLDALLEGPEAVAILKATHRDEPGRTSTHGN